MLDLRVPLVLREFLHLCTFARTPECDEDLRHVNGALVIPLKGVRSRIRAKIRPELDGVNQPTRARRLFLRKEPKMVLDVHLGLCRFDCLRQGWAVAPVVAIVVAVTTLATS